MVIIRKGENGIGKEIRGKLIAPSEYGIKKYGEFHYGTGADTHGTYRVRHRWNKTIQERMLYYVPTNPQTGPQQANRAKMTAGVIAWQGLTSEQKKIYNELAMEKNMFGFNFFLSEYLFSH